MVGQPDALQHNGVKNSKTNVKKEIKHFVKITYNRLHFKNGKSIVLRMRSTRLLSEII